MPHSFRRVPAHLFPIWLIFSLCAGADVSDAGNPARVPVQFSITQDVGAGNEVFVSGNHGDLTSGGIQPWGVKLHWTNGNAWSASIAIEA